MLDILPRLPRCFGQGGEFYGARCAVPYPPILLARRNRKRYIENARANCYVNTDNHGVGIKSLPPKRCQASILATLIYRPV